MNQDRAKLRVLFLSDGLAPFVTGGMQQHSTLLVKHLAPLVKHITLMHCGPINGSVPEEEEVLAELDAPTNVKAIGVELIDRGVLPGHYLRASKRLSQHYLEAAGALDAYDAVYAQGLTGNAFLGKHPKILVNLHGLEMFQPGFSLRETLAKAYVRPLFRRQIGRAWKLVSLGGQLTNILVDQGVSRELIAVIPNGIESQWIMNETALREKRAKKQVSPIRFVMVGRNEYRKGLHVLQAAMTRLEEPIEMHMIGDWPKWDAGIHTVIHHGIVREKAELMALLDACDVLLLPSLSEGMPTVVLEAFARGLEVIASDVGACSELVAGTGLLPASDPERLTLAIAEQASACSRYPLDRYAFEEIARKTLLKLESLK